MLDDTKNSPEIQSGQKTGDRVPNKENDGHQGNDVFASTGEATPALLGTVSRSTNEIYAVKKDSSGTPIYKFENDKELSKREVRKILSDDTITDKFGETIGKFKGKEVYAEKEWRTPQNGDLARVIDKEEEYLNISSVGKDKLTPYPAKSEKYPKGHPLENTPVPASGSFRNGTIIDTETSKFLEKHAPKSFNQEEVQVKSVAAKTIEAYDYLRTQSGRPKLNERGKTQAAVAYAYLDSKVENGWKKLFESGKNLTKSVAVGVATAVATTVGAAVLSTTLTPAVLVAGIVAGGVATIGRQIAARKDLSQRQDEHTTQEEKERNGFSVAESKVEFLGIREPIKQIVTGYAGRDYLEKGGEKQVHKDASRAKTISYLVGGIVAVTTGGSSLVVGAAAGIASKYFTDKLQLRTINAGNNGAALKNSSGAGLNTNNSLLKLFTASGKQAALTAGGFASLPKEKNKTEKGFASNYMMGGNIQNMNDYANYPPKGNQRKKDNGNGNGNGNENDKNGNSR